MSVNERPLVVGTFGTGLREVRVNLHESAVTTQGPGVWTGFTPGLAPADFSALSAAPRENPSFPLPLPNGPPKPPKLPDLALQNRERQGKT